jgi:hypothetical protein
LLNVPGGEITFTAVPTSSASSIGIAVSVSTQAKNIDFYINYFNLADKGTVKGKITDSNGNGVASAKLICQSRKTSISAFYAMDRNHSADASGNYSIDDMLSGKVAVAAGKHGVGNVFSSVEGTLSTGSSLTVDLQIPSQETLSGSFSVPSGFSSWLFTIPPVSAVLSENYFITMPTYESTSTSFNVSVPINKTYTISLQIDTSDYKKMTQAIEQNISVTAGQAVSKNLTLLDVPASITLATTETTSTLTWEAPSMWKPDFYMVWGSLYQNIPLGTYNYWFAFTDKTTITIPKVFITLYSTQTPLVYAMKADGTIDFNALDLTKLYPTQVSGLRWSK